MTTEPGVVPKTITWNDETHSLEEWAVKRNMSKSTLAYRFKLKWSLERIMTEPVSEPHRKIVMDEVTQKALYMRLRKLVVKYGSRRLADRLGVPHHIIDNAWRRKGRCGQLQKNIEEWETRLAKEDADVP